MRPIRGFLLQQTGSSLTLFIVALPLLLAILGIVVDSGLYGLALVRLSSAADSAALAAASAVDFAYFEATGEVRLDPTRARTKADAFAEVNYGDPIETTVTVPANQPRRVVVELRAKVQTVFLRIFGVSEAPVEAKSEAQVG